MLEILFFYCLTIKIIRTEAGMSYIKESIHKVRVSTLFCNTDLAVVSVVTQFNLIISSLPVGHWYDASGQTLPRLGKVC